MKVAEPNFDDSVRIVNGVISKYEEHHKISFTEEAVVASVKFAQRYLSEKNLPDIALDIVDEAASEFSVKEEFAAAALPSLAEQCENLEKQIGACKGKSPDKNAEAFDKLYAEHDKFTRGLDRLHGLWGHRVVAETGGEK